MLTDTARNEKGESEYVYYFGEGENIILKETMISSLSVAIVGLRQQIREVERKEVKTIQDHRDLCKYKLSKTTLQMMLNKFLQPIN